MSDPNAFELQDSRAGRWALHRIRALESEKAVLAHHLEGCANQRDALEARVKELEWQKEAAIAISSKETARAEKAEADLAVARASLAKAVFYISEIEERSKAMGLSWDSLRIDVNTPAPWVTTKVNAIKRAAGRESGVSDRGSGTQSGSRLQVPAAAKSAARHSPAETTECGT